VRSDRPYCPLSPMPIMLLMINIKQKAVKINFKRFWFDCEVEIKVYYTGF